MDFTPEYARSLCNSHLNIYPYTWKVNTVKWIIDNMRGYSNILPLMTIDAIVRTIYNERGYNLYGY